MKQNEIKDETSPDNRLSLPFSSFFFCKLVKNPDCLESPKTKNS